MAEADTARAAARQHSGALEACHSPQWKQRWYSYSSTLSLWSCRASAVRPKLCPCRLSLPSDQGIHTIKPNDPCPRSRCTTCTVVQQHTCKEQSENSRGMLTHMTLADKTAAPSPWWMCAPQNLKIEMRLLGSFSFLYRTTSSPV